MGSPVSPIVCSIYMEDFKQRVLAEATDPPRWWKRYVDDTYTVLKKDQAETLTKYLNTIDDDIKWTTEGEVHQEVEVEDMEKKVERCLVFLDTLSVNQRRRYYSYKSVQEGDPHRPVFELRQKSPPGAQTRCSENTYPHGEIHSE